MVISKLNTIPTILAILALPFTNCYHLGLNSDLCDFWNWIHYALVILLCSRWLWNLFVWIRLKLELLKLEMELFKTRQENVRLREEQLQLQDQLIQALNEYNDHLIRRLHEHQRFRDSLHEFLHFYAENSNSLDNEHLDDEDLDQADEIEIIFDTCTLLY